MNILKLASEAGIPTLLFPDGVEQLSAAHERFAALIRAEVLEEAAEWFLYEDNKHLFHSEMLWPHQVAERLRQLKDKP